MSAKKAVATTVGGSLAERPSWMGSTIRGNEGMGIEDMTVPRLAIIQDLSPQWKKNKDEYIEGAEVKTIFNTATKELYGESIFIVPVMFRKEWVIWKDIDSGGGFRGAFATAAEANAELAKLEDAAQCEINDTHQQFVLVVDPTSTLDNPKVSHAVISMSKSQCKPSRQLNTMISTSGGDRFERLYKMSVADAQNAAGQDYYNWKVDQLGYVDEVLFKLAEELYEAVKSGALDVKRDQDGAPAGPSEAGKVDDNDEF